MTWHLTLATEGREPLWTDRAGLARILRGLAWTGGSDVALFCVVDDHVHVVLRGERAAAGRLARALSTSVGARSGRPLAPSHLSPVEDRTHLVSLVDYVLRQSVRHDLGVHPAAWPGSCLWDLVGLRRLPGFAPATIAGLLPRFDPTRSWRAVDFAGPPASRGVGSAVATLGLTGALEGAADAHACDLRTRSDDAADARAIVVRLADEADLRPRVTAEALGLTERGLRKLRHREVDPAAIELVRRHLDLRCALVGAPPVTPNESERRSIQRWRAASAVRSADAVPGR